MANKPTKRWSTSLVTRKTQMKTTRQFSRMARIKNTDRTRRWQGHGATGTDIQYWLRIKWDTQFGELFGCSSKV